jgi:hypothetical protein
MRKGRFTEEQMVAIIREEDCEPVSAVAKRHGISEQPLGPFGANPTDRQSHFHRVPIWMRSRRCLPHGDAMLCNMCIRFQLQPHSLTRAYQGMYLDR